MITAFLGLLFMACSGLFGGIGTAIFLLLAAAMAMAGIIPTLTGRRPIIKENPTHRLPRADCLERLGIYVGSAKLLFKIVQILAGKFLSESA